MTPRLDPDIRPRVFEPHAVVARQIQQRRIFPSQRVTQATKGAILLFLARLAMSTVAVVVAAAAEVQAAESCSAWVSSCSYASFFSTFDLVHHHGDSASRQEFGSRTKLPREDREQRKPSKPPVASMAAETDLLQPD